MGYRNLPKTRYTVVRSRNSGEFWSEIYPDAFTENDAIEYMNRYHEKHPSDRVRIVKIDMTNFMEILGNRKRS